MLIKKQHTIGFFLTIQICIQQISNNQISKLLLLSFFQVTSLPQFSLSGLQKQWTSHCKMAKKILDHPESEKNLIITKI